MMQKAQKKQTCFYVNHRLSVTSTTDLPVDIRSGLGQPHHTVGVPSERRGVRRCLVEAARPHVHATAHLHQAHHALQLQHRGRGNNVRSG